MSAADSGDATKTALALNVRRAQAAAMLERMPGTIATNAGVSISALLVTCIDRGFTLHALWWFAAAIGTLALRLFAHDFIQRSDLPSRAPETLLKLMTFGALMSGLVWAALPYAIDNFHPLGLDGCVYILMCGMGTGAVLMGTGHSASSLAFALPVHVSVIVTFFLTGELSGMLLGLNVLALTIVLCKSSTKSESIVIGSVKAQLSATALAVSLSGANRDILLANERLEAMANSDPLTGLANRAAFNAALNHGITEATAEGGQLGLLILDLDRFKSVNDTFGHSVGDALLIEIAARLRASMGETGTIARLGGDEFAIIIGGDNVWQQAQASAQDILVRSRQPLVIDGHPVTIGTSIGISRFPSHAANAEDLFICADMALYRAKDGGRDQWRAFDPAFRAEADRRRQIEHDLAEALDGALEAWFQPQVQLATGTVIGFEALVRWRHPVLGPISPPEIVAAAQSANLADRLTATIAAAGCRLLNDLPGLGLPQATVAINVSPREFELYDVADVLNRVTRAHGIDPALFEIEITEEAILDALVSGPQLKQIERSGYKLAVDDFGAGHSSLAYLVGLKVDRLKLDRRFVTGIETSRQNQEIVGAMIGLGRALSMDVVAEGVETKDEAETLAALGCSIVQGYFLGRPMPVERLPHWIEEKRKKVGHRVA